MSLTPEERAVIQPFCCGVVLKNDWTIAQLDQELAEAWDDLKPLMLLLQSLWIAKMTVLYLR